MDPRTAERQRPQVHGVVNPAGARLAVAPRSRTPARGPWALGLLVLVAMALLAGLAGGLLRAGVVLPAAVAGPWLGRAALLHAALMIGAFMGTVVGIERAVAMRHPAAWVAPLASALAAPAALLGWDAGARWLLVLASLAFVGVNLLVVRRQPAAHTRLLLAGAVAWFAGNLLFALARGSGAVLPWWFAFLVMTIAAERLEMTRLMRRGPVAQRLLVVVLAALVVAAGLSARWPAAGGVLYGASLVLLAAWLLVLDIARRTVRAEGLARYMAVCLLGGYAWLAVGGLAWSATALGLPARDAALHALGLGFIVSMMLGHAPVILPAIARVKLLFGWCFYLPLAALHLSLVLRLGPGWQDPAWRAQGALLNVLAIALFAATVAGAAWAWRRDNPA